ncbi:hypothetical protein ABB39_01100 [Levilactobacillus brevis]|uniref:hypothetical protein n=1 Tax=Levilactobacillus brevis TaxID=1580 RepID=UPI0007607E97|nr:hypothetical protein [Levilactobacillus brevis]KWT52416.1 hypothetical protein ABB39_01100 [Levilactobacillus brevis]MCT3566502.1 hypothetical protein [Levilactobacillus brevis]ORJ54186.1 hypothetical protein LBR_09695 [Levilactobacillus brevis]
MIKNNHRTIIIEFSDRFDKDMVFEEISALCDKLSTEYGLHTVTNDLSATGIASADKITNNRKTWEQFSKVEAQHDTRTD